MKTKLAFACRKLHIPIVKEKFFTQLDLSDITWVEDRLLDLICDICMSIKELKLVGETT